MLEQWDSYDYSAGDVYYNVPDVPIEEEFWYYGTPVEEWPSESRYVQLYEQEQIAHETAQQAASSGGFIDTFSKVINAISPLATSILKSTMTPATSRYQTSQLTAAQRAALQRQQAGTGLSLAGITSNLPLLAAIGLGGFFLLSRKGKKGKK